MNKKAIFPLSEKFHFFGSENRGRQKKGEGTFMPEKLANIILAIMGIVVLLLIGSALLGMVFKQQEYQQAKATIDGIKETIDSLKVGQSKTYLIESPKGWSFTSLGKEFCLCKLDDSSLILTGEARLKKSCSEQGVCFASESFVRINLNSFEDLNIPTEAGAYAPDEGEFISQNYYLIKKVPLLMNMSILSNKTLDLKFS